MQKSDAAHKKSGSGWLRLLPGRGPTAPWAVLLLVVISSLIFVLFTFRDYGFTVDELNGYRRAQNVYRFLESFGANSEGVSQFSVYSFYGAMPDVVGMVLQNMFPSLELDARHLVSGLFGTVGVYYCGRLASRFSDLWTGTLAALLLLLVPVLQRHQPVSGQRVRLRAGQQAEQARAQLARQHVCRQCCALPLAGAGKR